MSAVGSSPSLKPSTGSHVTVELLKEAYLECIRKDGFHDYTRKVQPTGGAKSVKLQRIESLFEKATTWTQIPAKGSHRKYRNLITGIVVEFSAHTGGTNGNDFDTGAAKDMLERIQNHINILGNEIFKYPKRKWPEPDFKKSLANYRAWIAK